MARMPNMPTALPLGRNPTGRGLLIAALALLALGVVMVHSAAATLAPPEAWYVRREVRHTLFAGLAFLALLTLWRFDYRLFTRGRRAPWLAVGLLLFAWACGVLVFLPGVGHSVGGYHRWIRLGPERYAIGFQPSEIIKLALVVFLAAWLTRDGADVRSLRTLGPAVLAIAVSLGLVVTEDFGTAALIAVAAAVTLLLAGAPLRYLLAVVAAGGAGFYAFVYRVPHRWGRITAMLDPWCMGNPSAYQPRQSLVGILTGGWIGKGPGAGLQKMFLPERATDFIFSVYCEEWGFVGAILLFGVLGLWIWHSRRAALQAGDHFGRVLAGSLGFLIAFQAILHVAVDLVAAPPTGMGFPLVSAGGTALVIMAAGAAMVISVTARAQER